MALLALRDLAGLGGSLRVGQVERGGFQRCRQVRAVDRQQNGAEGGQTEAGAEVADGLRDARGLAVGEVARPVHGVGVGRAEHHAHPGSGHDDPDLLLAEAQGRRLRGPQTEADRGDGTADHDGPLGPLPVEHAAADLGGDHEADEEVQEEESGFGRRLVQRDLRILAGKEEDRDEGHHGDHQHDVLHREGADAEDGDLNEW